MIFFFFSYQLEEFFFSLQYIQSKFDFFNSNNLNPTIKRRNISKKGSQKLNAKFAYYLIHIIIRFKFIFFLNDF